MRSSDWSSDVCSSDLQGDAADRQPLVQPLEAPQASADAGRKLGRKGSCGERRPGFRATRPAQGKLGGVPEGRGRQNASPVPLHVFRLAPQWAKGTGAEVDDMRGLFATQDRKSVVQGKSVSVRVDLGCRRLIT